MNQLKPDVEEVFSNGSQVGSVNERENLKSLSIMKHLSKARVVLKKLRESRYHALCKTNKLCIDIQTMACKMALQIAFLPRPVGNLELT